MLFRSVHDSDDHDARNCRSVLGFAETRKRRFGEQGAFDGTAGQSMNRRSSVASTEVAATAGDDHHDDALTMARPRYPVDYITESTACELNVKVVNLDVKVAVGYALPLGPKRTYHCRPVPEGYAVVGVDEVVNPTFEALKLDHPAGEGGDHVEDRDAIASTTTFH